LKLTDIYNVPCDKYLHFCRRASARMNDKYLLVSQELTQT